MIVLHDDRPRAHHQRWRRPGNEKTLAELRQFDAGSWGPWTGGKFAGEKLPLPEEMVYESLRGGAFPVIHLKQSSLIPDIDAHVGEKKAICTGRSSSAPNIAQCEGSAKSIPRSEKRGWSKRPTSSGTGTLASWPRPRPRSARCWLPRAGQVTPSLVDGVPRGQAAGVDVDRSTTRCAWNNSSAWEWMGSSPTCRGALNATLARMKKRKSRLASFFQRLAPFFFIAMAITRAEVEKIAPARAGWFSRTRRSTG